MKSFLTCGGRLWNELTLLILLGQCLISRIRVVGTAVTGRHVGRCRCVLEAGIEHSTLGPIENLSHRDDVCHVQSRGLVAGTVPKSLRPRPPAQRGYLYDKKRGKSTRCSVSERSVVNAMAERC
jgi:hypothetical protein